MKRQQYRCKTVNCPYYKKEDRQTIYCGGIEENSSIHLAFGNDSVCKEYKDTRCRTDYTQCKIYGLLEGICNEK